MNLILCLDDHDGMAFNGRRQSMDRLVRARMAELTAGGVLRMNDYSFRQFKEPLPQAAVSEDFLTVAQPGEWCFCEQEDPAPISDRIEKLTVFRWNRLYPADRKCTLIGNGWVLSESRDFPGSSHETVTEETYVREN